MKQFKQREDLKLFSKILHDHITELCDDVIEDTTDTTFQCIIGGDVFIIENDDDLDQIVTLDGSPIKNGPQMFDVCEAVAGNLYVEFWLATNNGGGNAYFVPFEIASKHDFIKECVEYNSNEDH